MCGNVAKLLSHFEVECVMGIEASSESTVYIVTIGAIGFCHADILYSLG